MQLARLKKGHDVHCIAITLSWSARSWQPDLDLPFKALCTVLVPTSEFIQKLTAARLAADVVDVPTIIIARTDALGAFLLTSDIDERDRAFCTAQSLVHLTVLLGHTPTVACGTDFQNCRECSSSKHLLLRFKLPAFSIDVKDLFVTKQTNAMHWVMWYGGGE
eukprot:scaffold63016_cov15-Tisochrysis_lutea.AAC.1